MKPRNIALPEPLDKTVSKEAEERGISKAELHRAALRNYLEV